MAPPRIKRSFCRTCRRQVVTPEGGGHPRGWYNLTVNVPPEMGNSHNGQPYIFIGIFCSVDCLMAHESDMIQAEGLMTDVYEKE